jgi:hypothetical protein
MEKYSYNVSNILFIYDISYQLKTTNFYSEIYEKHWKNPNKVPSLNSIPEELGCESKNPGSQIAYSHNPKFGDRIHPIGWKKA